ncbi:MAG: polysaccharide deacetylase family protein [Demequinaceae bacterium]|nr:polysaccharide deacetylase family protein [Demequinaceae bacterium]
MSAQPRALIVRRRDIERDPRPDGGSFAGMALLPFTPPPFLTRGLGLFCVNTVEKVLAITYDDGPHPEHTPRILDVLKRHGAVATFFVLAGRARKHPEMVRRMSAEGHEIGLHGEDHQSLLTMGTREALARVRDARSAVEALVGAPITLYRPAYAEYTIAQATGIRGMGLDIVVWSADALDWLHDEELAIADRALATVFTGGILLLHEDRADPETLGEGEVLPAFDRARVLDLILQSLASDGYRTVTVGELRKDYQQVRSAAKHRIRAAR